MRVLFQVLWRKDTASYREWRLARIRACCNVTSASYEILFARQVCALLGNTVPLWVELLSVKKHWSLWRLRVVNGIIWLTSVAHMSSQCAQAYLYGAPPVKVGYCAAWPQPGPQTKVRSWKQETPSWRQCCHRVPVVVIIMVTNHCLHGL